MTKHTAPELHERRLAKLGKIIQRLESGRISKSDKQALQVIAGHYGVAQPTCSVERMYLVWATKIAEEIRTILRSIKCHPAVASSN